MPKTSKSSNTKGSSRSATSKASSNKNAQSMLEELFLDQLKDIYWAEKHLTKALPKMARAATSEELQQALDDHLTVTEEHITRCEQVFEMMEQTARAKKCDGMEGLVKEGEKVVDETEEGSATRDAGIIIGAQKVEHYEIAAYGSMVSLAKTIGRQEIADLLQQTLDEEKEADELLTNLAESTINISAEQESEGETEEDDSTKPRRGRK